MFLIAGGTATNYVEVLSSYHARTSSDNPEEYGFRSDMRDIAVGRSRCTFLDFPTLIDAAAMQAAGYYDGAPGPGGDSAHRTDAGYNALALLEVNAYLASFPPSSGFRNRVASTSRRRSMMVR